MLKILVGLFFIGSSVHAFAGMYLRAGWFIDPPYSRMLRDALGEEAFTAFSYLCAGGTFYLGLAVMFGFHQ